MVEPTHEFARALGELSDRLRQQRAEEERVGHTLNDDRIEHAYKVLHAVEDKIEALVPVSVLALGAHLIRRIEGDDDEEEELRVCRATLAAIRPQLVGPIAEDADRVLAQEAEEASS